MNTRSILKSALAVPLVVGIGLGTLSGTASAAPATSTQAAAQPASASYATWYSVTTYTSNIPEAGTDGDVWLRINGTKGSSNWLYLDNSDNNFERGKFDNFSYLLSNVGTLKSVDVYFNRAGWYPAWHLGYVRVNGVYFPVNRWFTSSGTNWRFNRA